ncbi:hypothetical protein CANCADRAFT_31235 [Tortispora caseinolytica NRRL Y-17796]|uniref:PPM-type phosphatase domain-containing protein n=1 Tax=Tortispora caseinolytica NRRL Y-17796 TaxID=767744 RepID=A0A1E4TET5_9ASCO|nr:hypothetical protein CANCADRAFT_31235 [Tortispora caseinolytica NRRL Y-17796]
MVNIRKPLGRVSFNTARRSVSSYYVTSSVPKSGASVTLRLNLLQVPSYIGHFSSRMDRPQNEDRYSASLLTLPAMTSFLPKKQRQGHPGTNDVFCFAVYDGHGGDQCSKFLADHLAEYVENCDLASAAELEQKYADSVGGYWRRRIGALQKCYQDVSATDDLAYRLPLSYLTADYQYTVEQSNPCGSTCTAAYLYSHNPEIPYWSAEATSSLVIGHVGDTRCIIADREGNAHALTRDHHPSSPDESHRIRRYATNIFTDSFGEERFGILAVTRAFGDKRMKRMGVSAEPEITQMTISPNENKNAFLVLVSDGVTGMASDQEIVDIVYSTYEQLGARQGTPQRAAQDIVKYIEAIGGDDNATCMVVRLPGWGNWNRAVDQTGELREFKLRNSDMTNRRRQ